MIKGVAHIGLVVKSIEQARAFYSSALGLDASSIEDGPEMRVSMVDANGVMLELLEPVGSEGTLAKFLERRGEGIHHICLEVDDIEAEIRSLEGQGVALVDRTPRRGIEGKIAFIHPKSSYGTLIELVERPPE
jgi:methylmalonyl-CoA epimerase